MLRHKHKRHLSVAGSSTLLFLFLIKSTLGMNPQNFNPSSLTKLWSASDNINKPRYNTQTFNPVYISSNVQSYNENNPSSFKPYIDSQTMTKYTNALNYQTKNVAQIKNNNMDSNKNQTFYNKLFNNQYYRSYNDTFKSKSDDDQFKPITSSHIGIQSSLTKRMIDVAASPTQPSYLHNTIAVDARSMQEERGKINKKYKKFMLPLLLAYKLKFFTLVPLLMGGLVLLAGSTGLAGFFFALFAATMGLKAGGGH